MFSKGFYTANLSNMQWPFNPQSPNSRSKTNFSFQFIGSYVWYSMENLAGDLLSILPTLSTCFIWHRLGELRSRYLGIKGLSSRSLCSFQWCVLFLSFIKFISHHFSNSIHVYVGEFSMDKFKFMTEVFKVYLQRLISINYMYHMSSDKVTLELYQKHLKWCWQSLSKDAWDTFFSKTIHRVLWCVKKQQCVCHLKK